MGKLFILTIQIGNETAEIFDLLVEGYAKITVLDARYLNEVMIGNFVTFEEQDVLFIHSTGVLNNETAF